MAQTVTSPHSPPGRARRWYRPAIAVLTGLTLAASALTGPAQGAPSDRPLAQQQPAPVAAELAATVRQDAGDRVQALLMLENPQRYDSNPAAVVDQLKAYTGERQDEVETALEERAATQGDVRILNRFWITNMLLVEFTATADRLSALAETPGVQEVLPNFTLTLPDEPAGAAVNPSAVTADTEVTWGLDRIGAPRVWDELGLDGSGVRVVTLDTGVAINHPDLAGKMFTTNPADPRYPGGWMEFNSTGGMIASEPHDSAYHGTHVSGTIHGSATSGLAIGVAPGAELAHGLVIPGGSGSFAQVAAGMQWAIAPTDAGGNPAGRRADVVSMSLGGAGYHSEMVAPTRAILAAGAFPSFAIGNSPCGVGTASPGNVYEAVGIGATDIDENVATFSCGGVVPKSGWSSPPADWPDSYVKPDLSAPGVNVISADPNGTYRSLNGTSMATPHTSGTVALLRQGAPELSVGQLREALVETSVWDDRYATSRPDTRYGHGRIDAYAAAGRVALDSGITGLVTRGGTGAPVAGARVTVTPGGNSAVTGADGRYTLRLSPGTYSVAVSAFGHEPATVDDVTVTDEQFRTVDVTLTALPVGTISGTTTFSPSGHGIPGVTVSVAEVPGGASTSTDVSGRYSLTLPAGTYTLSADHPQFTGGQPVEVTVEAGTTFTQDFAFSPPPQKVAYVGTYGDDFVDEVFAPRGIEADLFDWDELADAATYPLVVLGYGTTSAYNQARFQAFLDATDANGSGVIFLDHAYTTGNGLRQLSQHTGHPVSTGSNTGGSSGVESFYEITAEHPIFAGLAVGDRIPLDTLSTKWIAWFNEYSGDGRQTIASMGRTDSGGIYGGGIGVDQRATNRHVLMSSHGASATRGPGDWTPQAEEIFVNALNWAARPAAPDQAYFAAHSLQVTPEVVKVGEPVTVRAQVKNVGASSGSYAAVLKVNGEPVTSSTATIASGANRQYTWTVSGEELGTYTVEFAHLSESFRVRPPQVTLTAKTVDAPGAAAPGPLADATVELIHDGDVLPVGVTGADGTLTFDTPAATGRYTLVVRRPRVGDADAYLLHRVITVIDDDAVVFAPRVLAGGAGAASVGENFATRVDLAARSADAQHEALAYLRPSTTAPWGYAYPAGRVIATLDSYQAVTVHKVSRLEQDWWLPSEIIRDLDWVDPYDVTFSFGGEARAEVVATRQDDGAKVRVDWDVTDAFGHPYATVLATAVRPFADLPDVLPLENVVAAVRGEAPQEQLPILRFSAPDGTPLRAGSIGWNAQPFTFDVADPLPGRYRVAVELNTGSYSGQITAEAPVVLLDEPVVRTSLPETASQDDWLRYEVGIENPSAADLGQVTWTVTIAQPGTALKPTNVALQLRVGDTWQKVGLTASGGKLVGTVAAPVALPPGAAHTWQLRVNPKVAGTLTVTNTFQGGGVDASVSDPVQVSAPRQVDHRIPV